MNDEQALRLTWALRLASFAQMLRTSQSPESLNASDLRARARQGDVSFVLFK